MLDLQDTQELRRLAEALRDAPNARAAVTAHCALHARIRHDTVLTLLDRAEAARALPGWQPIETCPEKRIVLLFAVTDVAEDGRVRNYKMHTGDLCVHDDGTRDWTWNGRPLAAWDALPTHWMPLPEPPK